MKFFKFVLLSLCMLLWHAKLLACTCLISGLCENIGPTSFVIETSVIKTYKAINSSLNFVDVEITDLLYGSDTLSHDTLTLSLSNSTCEPVHISYSDSGDMYVFIIDELETRDEATYPTFGLSECERRHLWVRGDSIYGIFENLAPPLESQALAYAPFKENFENACELLLTTYHPEPLRNALSVFPNPTQDELRVKMNHRQDIEYIIYSNIGKQMKAGKEVQQSDFGIDIRDFPPGVYYLKFQTGGQIFYEKVLKI